MTVDVFQTLSVAAGQKPRITCGGQSFRWGSISAAGALRCVGMISKMAGAAAAVFPCRLVTAGVPGRGQVQANYPPSLCPSVNLDIRHKLRDAETPSDRYRIFLIVVPEEPKR